MIKNFSKSLHFTIFVMLLLPISFSSNAGWAGNLEVKKMFGNSKIFFGVNTPPSDTCDYHGRDFIFDATTEGGKNMLSMLIAAYMADKKVDVWYTSSSLPGTTDKNGCNRNTMAVMTQVGFSEE